MEEKKLRNGKQQSKDPRRGHPCVCCTKRNATVHLQKTRFMLCRPCLNAIDLGKNWADFGLTKPRRPDIGLMPSDPEAFLAEYLPMLNAGWSQDQMAQRWGVQARQVAAKVNRIRQKGYVVPCRTRPEFETRATAPQFDERGLYVARGGAFARNEHGGGRWGIKNCTDGPNGTRCGACRERAQKTRREIKEARRLKNMPS